MTRPARPVLAWAAVLLVLSCGAALARSREPRRELLVVNALAEAVDVDIGGTTVRVPEVNTSRTFVAPGVFEVEVRAFATDLVLDRHRVRIPRGGRATAVYNVLGAAPLYRVDIRSSGVGLIGSAFVNDGPQQRYENFASLAGRRSLEIHADVVFQPAPDEVRGAWAGATRTYLGWEPGGWKANVWYAIDNGADPDEVRALLARLVRAYPTDAELPWIAALLTAASGGTSAALAPAEAALRATPDARGANEVWAWALRSAGRTAELRSWYRAATARAPRWSVKVALLLGALPRSEAAARAPAAVSQADGDEQILAAAAYVLSRTGRVGDAAAVYRTAPLAASTDRRVVEYRIRTFVDSGDPKGASAAALEALKLEDAGWLELARYLRVAALPGAAPEVAAADVLATWAEKSPDQERRARALAGLTARPSASDARPLDLVAAILESATWDPREALALCRKVGPGTLVSISPEVAALLALEAYRTGDAELFDRLRWSVALGPAEIAAYVERGVEPEPAWWLDEPTRAALALARERTLQAAGAPVPPAVARAARADPLRSAAVLAADRWPAPERANSVVVLQLEPAPR